MSNIRRSRPRHLPPFTVAWAAVLAALVATPAAARSDALRDGPQRWLEGPFRQFGVAQPLAAGRAILLDETDDPAVRAALSSELQRLDSDFFGRDGWRTPFESGQPLRIYLARWSGEGVHQVTGEATAGGRLARPAVLLDASGLNAAQIAREVSRQIVRAAIAAYGAPDDAFLTPALIEGAAADPAESIVDDDAWSLAAAPTLDYRAHPEVLGKLWVEDVIRDRGGSGFFRQVWERAAAGAEAPFAVALRMFAESGGPRAGSVLLRSAARLYAALEAEPAPSRLRRFDLESGGLDAAAPEELVVRHRSFLPEDAEDALRVAWPEDGGAGAAIVRYRDAALPADVVFFAAGDVRRIPLSGVLRVDWLVAGSAGGGRELRAPAVVESARSNVFTGLEVRAVGAGTGTGAGAGAGADRPRLIWRTAAHDGLWGWAVFREELRADGRVARTGPEIVPSSERSEESFGYVFVDSQTTPGNYYRYTVWAVTDEGLLARAFALTLRAGE